MSVLKKKKVSRFRRINNWLHLWMGLISGVIVFTTCLTASIWVFRDEITYFVHPYNQVEQQHKPYLPPAALLAAAKNYAAGLTPQDTIGVIYSLAYRKPGKSVLLNYASNPDGDYSVMYMDPYTGKILCREKGLTKLDRFLLFLRAGHRFFWLPRDIGSPIVDSACLLFFFLLISGLIWWYPNRWSKANIKKSFTVKWDASWKRLNLDLHNVFGFYVLLFAFVLTTTGMAFGFEWFREGYHWVIAGGHPTEERSSDADSDSTLMKRAAPAPMDVLWRKHMPAFLQHKAVLLLVYPDEPGASIYVAMDETEDSEKGRQWWVYDQYSLKELKHNEDFSSFNLGEKIYRLNAEIHFGTIGGLPTKILASLTSLVGASLPLTGVLIWYNRRWGKKKKQQKPGKVITAV